MSNMIQGVHNFLFEVQGKSNMADMRQNICLAPFTFSRIKVENFNETGLKGGIGRRYSIKSQNIRI